VVDASLERIGESVRPILDARFAVRESALARSRLVIRASANAIRSLHRGELTAASDLVAEAKAILRDITGDLAAHPAILTAGFVEDAAKEYAEACLTMALFAGWDLPTPAEIAVDPVPYLHGLGEAVGECRRRLLDRLRAGDLDEAELLLATMDQIVDLLASLDYPDGMTGGLRRTTDVARSLVERSRADVTATVVQERLRLDLADYLGASEAFVSETGGPGWPGPGSADPSGPAPEGGDDEDGRAGEGDGGGDPRDDAGRVVGGGW